MVIICGCRQIEEEVVKAVIADGYHTVEQIADRCGAGAECGSCHYDIEDLISEYEIKENK